MDRVNHPGGAEEMKTKKPRWSAKKKAEAVLRLGWRSCLGSSGYQVGEADPNFRGGERSS